jgi:hypothetical protein
MEPQNLIDTILGIGFTVLGWFARELWSAVKENAVEISSKFHRHVVAPGNDYSAEDVRVKAICAILHTPEVIAAYQAAQESARLPAQG